MTIVFGTEESFVHENTAWRQLPLCAACRPNPRLDSRDTSSLDPEHHPHACSLSPHSPIARRFDPELSDGANAGLSIAQDMLKPMKEKFPDVSVADTWTFAGAEAVRLCGGPEIEHSFGRSDAASDDACPPNGRLPDATQGAKHLRDVFYRMGFDDREIVALSGAHTLGRCHLSRSGFDGPWTTNPLKFDNEVCVGTITLFGGTDGLGS